VTPSVPVNPNAAHALLVRAAKRMQAQLAQVPQRDPWNQNVLAQLVKDLAPHLAAEIRENSA